MATRQKSFQDTDLNKETEKLLQEAMESIHQEKYQEAYDILSQKVEETADANPKDYRDEKTLANMIDNRIPELLSEVTTKEPYKNDTLEQSKEELQEIAKNYDKNQD